ncbi:MAG: ABC transporter permease, partial [Acidobacteria bacterium]|nr:ABC transporter permease [Acidobacteriota bacterium]
LKDVRHHLGKFAATIIGVGLLQGIVLTMNGIYRGNIMDGIWLIDHAQVDLWVVERGRGGPFNEQSRIPDQMYRAVSAVPGVEKASPFISYVVEREVAGKSRQFTIIGYDVLGGLGGAGSHCDGTRTGARALRDGSGRQARTETRRSSAPRSPRI